MTAFFEIFQPGLRHLREERNRQKMTVANPGHGGGAPLGIDLDAGTAKIKIFRRPPADPEADDAPAGPASSGAAAAADDESFDEQT